MGIEPTQPAWKAGILAIELHPHQSETNNTIFATLSQGFLPIFLIFFIIF